MSRIMYGCCVGDWGKFTTYVVLHDRQQVALSGQTSIAVAYNRMMDIARLAAVDMLVLQHDDLEITDEHAEEKLLAAVGDRDVLVAGVAGGRGITSLAWWNSDMIGHQLTESGPLDFSVREGDADILEGSLLAFPRRALEQRVLRFDEHEGFHGYDEITYRATKMGGRAVVVDVDTYHHVHLGFKSRDSELAWHVANERFQRKWGFA